MKAACSPVNKGGAVTKILSVVVPVFNTERTLPRCLRSVLTDETRGSIELILVNDGSSDGSGAILRDYARRCPDAVVLIEKGNGGHGSAINAGLEAATGRYFRVLDSDDWMDTPGLLRFLERLRGCWEDAVVTPYTQEYVSDGREVLYDYLSLRDGQSYGADSLPRGKGEQYLTMASTCYRTQLLREAGLRLYENCSYVDMQYNVFPIPFLRSFRFINIPLYRYMIGREGQSMDKHRLLRQLPQHQRVLLFLVRWYACWRDQVSPAAEEYLAQLVSYMYYTHVHLIRRELPERPAAFRMLRDFEREVRAISPELWQRASSFQSLRLSRILGYADVLLTHHMPIASTLARGRREPGA